MNVVMMMTACMDDCDHEDNGIIDKDNDVIENRDGNNKCAYC